MNQHTNFSTATKLCAIVGHPVGHSMSPAIHNAAFTHLGLDYVYLGFDTAPAHLEAALAAMRGWSNFRGLSVTIPHKIDVLKLVDQVSEVDRAIGSINTVINDNGQLIGVGTDGPGARMALRDAGVNPADKQVVVVGTGGAARAIAFDMAFNATPRSLTLIGVETEQMNRLADDLLSRSQLEKCVAAIAGKEAANRAIKNADLLINASPIGMFPKVEASPIDPAFLHPNLAVMDIVYNPLETTLLRNARQKGLTCVSGATMFVNQAVAQFEYWTGQRAPRTLMNNIVMDKLAGAAK